MTHLEGILKEKLGTSTFEAFGHGGGGCINTGQSYITDHGKIFIKTNEKDGAREMFDGEFTSLDTIYKTNTIRTVKPLLVMDDPEGGAVLVTEHLQMKRLKSQQELGRKLAELHLHNAKRKEKIEKEAGRIGSDAEDDYVHRFGFHVPTSCGFILQDNTWEDDWPTFFARRKLNQQLELIDQKFKDTEARMLWGKLQHKIPSYFDGLDITPALLHGDLWCGNSNEMADGSGPVVFDPASFYGHHEYDLGIAEMFGGYSSDFFKGYHSLCPQKAGHDQRNQLYQLFHYLNHWNHFGSGYRDQSLSIMRRLI
ncbi:hypothetical protein CAPTEDRAFT_92436 [Capitella teleta]|uniref:protein-ribulosamine 3-kinase n=1 Tax=Capitella teleta TaxID=283909 RepID=R7U5W5_CAPTE|nr:hypothetical protein CAPTEDRAFT_92436 [Capitella teleta]|eukprot:ELU01461.1 hypothetical protein CAPTEDRAFT_92436 [Capitella teleta]